MKTKTLMMLFGMSLLLILSMTATAAADGVQQVPEPLSLATLGLGIAGLAGYKLYKKRK